VIVGGGRQGDQDCRPARRRDFRERRRARAADDYVRGREPVSHVVEKRLDFGLKPRVPITGAHQLHIPFSRLVDEMKMRRTGRQPRRCLHHGHVDCVRALRAAKN